MDKKDITYTEELGFTNVNGSERVSSNEAMTVVGFESWSYKPGETIQNKEELVEINYNGNKIKVSKSIKEKLENKKENNEKNKN